MKTAVSIFAAATCVLKVFAIAQPPPSAVSNVPENPAPAAASEPATPHHPDENSQLLQEWAPPTDELHTSGSGDARGFLGHYLSTRPLSEVWTYYAGKLGMTPAPTNDQPYRANLYT